MPVESSPFNVNSLHYTEGVFVATCSANTMTQKKFLRQPVASVLEAIGAFRLFSSVTYRE